MPSAGARHVSLTTARCVSILLAFVLAVMAGMFAPVEGAAKLGRGEPLPLAFEPNQGHADPSVKFLTRGRGYGSPDRCGAGAGADQLSATIRIPLQIEPGAQPTKSFSVLLTNPRGGVVIGPQSTTEVRITDTR